MIEKKKVFYAVFILMIFIVSCLTLLNLNEKRGINYEELKNTIVNNFVYKVDTNNIFKEYIYYMPNGYRSTKLENNILFENNEAKIIVYFGKNVKLSKELLDKTNQAGKVLFKYQEDNDNQSTYIYFFENEDSLYNTVLIGKNDTTIEGIIPVNKLNSYVIDMANIVQSITKFEKENNYDV